MAAQERAILSQKAHELQEKVAALLKNMAPKTSPKTQCQANRAAEGGRELVKHIGEDGNGGHDSPASLRTPILELTARGIGSGASSPQVTSPPRVPSTQKYMNMSQEPNVSQRNEYEQPIRYFSSRSSGKSRERRQPETGRLFEYPELSAPPHTHHVRIVAVFQQDGSERVLGQSWVRSLVGGYSNSTKLQR